jgi:hypothetical protein
LSIHFLPFSVASSAVSAAAVKVDQYFN